MRSLRGNFPHQESVSVTATIAIKHHVNPDGGDILAVADKELIGKTLEDGEIHFKVSKHFYHEDEVSEKELEETIVHHSNINLIGNIAFAIAQKKGLVSEKTGIKIAGVWHAQIYTI